METYIQPVELSYKRRLQDSTALSPVLTPLEALLFDYTVQDAIMGVGEKNPVIYLDGTLISGASLRRDAWIKEVERLRRLARKSGWFVRPDRFG